MQFVELNYSILPFYNPDFEHVDTPLEHCQSPPCNSLPAYLNNVKLDEYGHWQSVDLSGKVYGVAGSGDKFYGKYFNTTVDHFDVAFKQAGASRGAAKAQHYEASLKS